MKKAAFFLSFFLLAGCNSISWKGPVDYDEGGSTMVVIPFREGDFRRHFESSIGREIAERVEELIGKYAKEGTYRIVPYAAIGKDMMEELRNSDPRDIDWTKVAKAANADIVLSGNVTQFETRREGAVNLFSGTCQVKVFAVRSGEKKTIYSRTHLVRHPGGETFELPFDLESNDQKMRIQLILKTAKECAEPFYPPPSESK